MRTNPIFLLPILLFMVACDHKPPTLPDCLSATSGFVPEDCPEGGNCSFTFYPDSKLEISEVEEFLSFEVKPGTNLVFHFYYERNDHPMIMDDEYQEGIYFEVKLDGDSFLITADELEASGVIFGRMCFCPDAGYRRMQSGCIYGYKIDECTWNISMNLTATSEFNSYNKMKQQDFVKKTRP